MGGSPGDQERGEQCLGEKSSTQPKPCPKSCQQRNQGFHIVYSSPCIDWPIYKLVDTALKGPIFCKKWAFIKSYERQPTTGVSALRGCTKSAS